MLTVCVYMPSSGFLPLLIAGTTSTSVPWSSKVEALEAKTEALEAKTEALEAKMEADNKEFRAALRALQAKSTSA